MVKNETLYFEGFFESESLSYSLEFNIANFVFFSIESYLAREKSV